MATLTESLLNGLKSLFSGLSTKTTDSSYAVPLLNSSKEPTGDMTLANVLLLASQKMCGITEACSVDLNNYKVPGVYKTGQASETNALANCPVTGGAFILFVFNPYAVNNTTSGCFQLLVTYQGIFYRTFGNNNWTAWGKVTITSV